MDYKTRLTGLCLAAGVLISTAVAQQHEEHGSHSHGEAQLTFVLEGNEAELAFVTPTVNVVGFEHQPKDQQQQQMVQKMLADFTQANWFSFDAEANCTVSNTDISSDLTSANPSKPIHADLNANYTLVCQNPALLRQLSLQLATLAPAIQHVKVQWIVNGEQGAAEWSASADKISLSAAYEN